ncbi:MAG: AIR synthase family protein [Deltaproteobacteria bacterium]|nr:AIR synthase family protein [Deltaproteobacteria bacterium]
MSKEILPVGKIPLDLLDSLLKNLATDDPAVLVGPGIGEDAAVIRFGSEILLFKTDPITFAVSDIAWYLVTVNANDIACMGGVPRYLLVTLLLPEGKTTPDLVRDTFEKLTAACSAADIRLIGGHSEVTYGIDRPLVTGFMIGTLATDKVIRTSGARPGNLILLSKSIPLEALALLAREVPDRIDLDTESLAKVRDLIYDPGLSVVKEARLALEQGAVSAMHDPTEGGLATGLLELARASGCGLEVYREKIPIMEQAAKILPAFDIDPLGAIASGSLLVCCEPEGAHNILNAWRGASISGAIIGRITAEPELKLYHNGICEEFPVFETDEIAKVFSS